VIEIVESATNTIVRTIPGPKCPIASVDWSADGNFIVVASTDELGVRVWNVNTGELTATIQRGSQGFTDAKWSPDGQRIAYATVNTIAFMNPLDGSVESKMFGGGAFVAWHYEGSQLLLGGLDYGNVDIVDIPTEQRTRLSLESSGVSAVDWSPDGTRAAWGTEGGDVKVWNVVSAQLEASMNSHQDIITALDWKPDSTQLASVGYDGTVRVLDVTNGQELVATQGEGQLYAVAWKPDGTTLAYGGEEGVLKIIPVLRTESKTGPKMSTAILLVMISRAATYFWEHLLR
jgi:WD40 repeat protein